MDDAVVGGRYTGAGTMAGIFVAVNSLKMAHLLKKMQPL